MSIFISNIPEEALAAIEEKHERQKQIQAAVGVERDRQDEKWGEQNHNNDRWNTILAEEIGEIAQCILNNNRKEMLKELIQAQAVLQAWVESDLRQHGPYIESLPIKLGG